MTEKNAAALGTERLTCHAMERLITNIWSEYFDRPVSPYDDFFDLGGDSIDMIEVVGRLRDCGLPVRSSVAMRHSTPARFAESLTVHAHPSSPDLGLVDVPALRTGATPDSRTDGPEPDRVRLAPIGGHGPGDALYVVHSDNHREAERRAVSAWTGERAAKGLPLCGPRGTAEPGADIAQIAGRYLRVIQEDQASGPYRLAGFGLGAVVAYEIARQARAQGARIALLVLIDPPVTAGGDVRAADRDRLLGERIATLAARFGLTGDECVEEVFARFREAGWYDDEVCPRDVARLQRSWVELTIAARGYQVGPYDGTAVLWHDTPDSVAAEEPWRRAVGELEIHRLNHGVASPHAIIGDARLATAMRQALAP